MIGWNDSFALGVPLIDAQHKQLFTIISELNDAMLRRQGNAVLGTTLDKLLDYTAKHFSAEEQMLVSKGYFALAQHKRIHEHFKSMIKKYSDDFKAVSISVNVQLMNLLQDWLVHHIQGTDMEYVRALDGKL